MTNRTDYTDHGYTNRREYLDSLADDLGIDPATVYALADILGPSEDFDGLVTSLEDYADELHTGSDDTYDGYGVNTKNSFNTKADQ